MTTKTRPGFLDQLTEEQLKELSRFLKQCDNEFVSSLDGMYCSRGYVVELALFKLLKNGPRYR